MIALFYDDHVKARLRELSCDHRTACTRADDDGIANEAVRRHVVAAMHDSRHS